jgi:DNA polymerase-3 subunit epsilon
MTRHIILDTETTGLSPEQGHRIVEIGAVEMINFSPTGKQLHLYMNPEREMEAEAERIHGLSTAFLSDKPLFIDIAQQLIDFIGDDVLVIHNAPFDVGFLNAELSRCKIAPLSMDRVIDTLPLARQKFPGAQASLDALCRRFDIDNTHRDLHGALIDADLLASVFVELKGGRQPGLALQIEQEESHNKTEQDNTLSLSGFMVEERPIRPARPSVLKHEEQEAHNKLLGTMKTPIWHQTE